MSIEVKILNTSGTPLLWEPDAVSLVDCLEKAVKAGRTFPAGDFRGLNLRGANLSNGSFVGAKFEGANLIGVNFTSANLTNCDFSGAMVTEVTWTTATLAGVDADALSSAADATTAGTAIPSTEKAAASGVASLSATSKVVQDPANAQAAGGVGKIPLGAAVTGALAASWGGVASSLATLDAGVLVVENPANATATPTASKIPMTGAGGAFLAEGWRRPTPTAYDFATAVPYAVLATDEALDVTSGAVSDDVDLPTAVGCAGRTISVKKVDAGAGVIAVDPAGVEHIEGLGAGNPYNLTAQYQGVTLRSDGAKWNVVTSTTTTAAHAALHLNAGADPVRLTVRTPAAGACAILTTDHYVRAASLGAGAVAATLYAADAAAVGRVVTVVKVDVAADDVNVTPAGAETINGVNALYALAAQWNSVTLLCVAVGAWEIIASR